MSLRTLLRHAPDWGWWTGMVFGVVAVVLGANAWAISAYAEPVLSSSMEPASGLHPSGFDHTIAGEN